MGRRSWYCIVSKATPIFPPYRSPWSSMSPCECVSSASWRRRHTDKPSVVCSPPVRTFLAGATDHQEGRYAHASLCTTHSPPHSGSRFVMTAPLLMSYTLYIQQFPVGQAAGRHRRGMAEGRNHGESVQCAALDAESSHMFSSQHGPARTHTR